MARARSKAGIARRAACPGWRAAGLLLAVASGASVGCGPAAPDRPPDVLILTLDTLRADALSCYGAPPGSSPAIDAFAARATRFQHAFATAPWTVPSHASLFTGLLPSEHGATTREIELPPGADARLYDNASALPLEATTLAEVLREQGYATAGIVANAVYLAPRFQLGQGFDQWTVIEPWTFDAVSPAWGDAVNEHATRWLTEHLAADPERPFFLFLNYFDTHRPYDVRPDSALEAFRKLDELHERVMVEGLEAGELGAEVRGLYARAVKNLDRHVGELFERLRRMERFENALIVLTSDHGEYFGEHGLVEHSKDVYEAAMRIPLIVKSPRQSEGRVEIVAASLADVPGLVAAHMPRKLARPLAERFPRRPGSHPVVGQNRFSRPKDVFHPVYGERFRRERRVIWDLPWKLILSSDGAHELYDLEADPAEQRNLFDERADVADRMRERLERAGGSALSGASEAPLPAPLTAEEAERMRAAGYAGGDDE